MKTILVVDDEEQLRKMLALVLRKNGYHVIEADSGAEGLALARRHLPDLILSDIHMPDGDGTTLLRALRQDSELRTKQIVLMTGKPELVTPRRAMEEGADDFLAKPVSIKALLGCVEARFERASISWRVEDRALAQFRGSVPARLPHEFFTPLAGIIGLMEVLREDSSTLAPPEVVAIYDSVARSAHRLHRTLRNYLLILEDPTRFPPGMLPPELSSEDAEREIGWGVDEALQFTGRREDVTVEFAPCAIFAEPDVLRRIVEELVDNACKYSRHGTPVEVKLTSGGTLTVTDEGRGLTSNEIASIGAFHQFDRNEYEQQGLGLGLVLVQKLSAQCRGEFSIKSEPGNGTRVQIDLKLATAA